MKIKINAQGNLEIERAGKFRKQACPFQWDEFCGNWCPLFGEPQPIDPHHPKSDKFINLCHNRALVGSVIDERVKEPKP